MRKFELAMMGVANLEQSQPEAAVLVDLQCWSKITYLFGFTGPEIMFFCLHDPMVNEYLPDLEPIKVHVHLLDEQLQPIAPSFLNGKRQLTVLLSSKITLKAL